MVSSRRLRAAKTYGICRGESQRSECGGFWFGRIGGLDAWFFQSRLQRVTLIRGREKRVLS